MRRSSRPSSGRRSSSSRLESLPARASAYRWRLLAKAYRLPPRRLEAFLAVRFAAVFFEAFLAAPFAAVFFFGAFLAAPLAAVFFEAFLAARLAPVFRFAGA